MAFQSGSMRRSRTSLSLKKKQPISHALFPVMQTSLFLTETPENQRAQHTRIKYTEILVNLVFGLNYEAQDSDVM